MAREATKPELQAPKPGSEADISGVVKDIENALFTVKFYPVAVDEKSKNEAIAKIEAIYGEGNETVRQLLIYMIHETLAQGQDLKIMHTYDYFKLKNPGLDPTQLRVNVYRAIFNYNTSVEGIVEMIALLGRLRGSEDAVKLLTYHFSHLSTYESEASHMLRAAIIESLGKTDSAYALKALLHYAQYTDNERTFQRLVSALGEWEEKIGKLDMPAAEKARTREKLRKVITSEFRGTQYR